LETEIALGLQASLRVGRLMDEGKDGAGDDLARQAQQLPRRSISRALSRDMHAATASNRISTSCAQRDLETVNTYEGTHDGPCPDSGAGDYGHSGVFRILCSSFRGDRSIELRCAMRI